MTMIMYLYFLMVVSICTINVHGIAEFAKRQKVFHSLLASNFDIFVLQETHLADINHGKLWEIQWGGRALWSPGSTRSAGVGVLVHPNSTVAILDSKIDTAGRVVSAKLSYNNVPFQVVNVYAPSSHSERVTAADRVGIDFDLLPDHRVKTFYGKLAFPPPRQLPCTIGWDTKFSISLPWPKIWPHIYGGLSTNWECDIAWKIAHGVLKTRSYLRTWRQFKVSKF